MMVPLTYYDSDGEYVGEGEIEALETVCATSIKVGLLLSLGGLPNLESDAIVEVGYPGHRHFVFPNIGWL